MLIQKTFTNSKINYNQYRTYAKGLQINKKFKTLKIIDKNNFRKKLHTLKKILKIFIKSKILEKIWLL